MFFFSKTLLCCVLRLHNKFTANTGKLSTIPSIFMWIWLRFRLFFILRLWNSVGWALGSLNHCNSLMLYVCDTSTKPMNAIINTNSTEIITYRPMSVAWQAFGIVMESPLKWTIIIISHSRILNGHEIIWNVMFCHFIHIIVSPTK